MLTFGYSQQRGVRTLFFPFAQFRYQRTVYVQIWREVRDQRNQHMVAGQTRGADRTAGSDKRLL